MGDSALNKYITKDPRLIWSGSAPFLYNLVASKGYEAKNNDNGNSAKYIAD